MSKISKYSKFRAAQMVKMAKCPKLIWCKIWVAEKSWYLHILYSHLGSPGLYLRPKIKQQSHFKILAAAPISSRASKQKVHRYDRQKRREKAWWGGWFLLAVIALTSIRQMVLNGAFIREIHLDLREQIWPLVCRLIQRPPGLGRKRQPAKIYSTTLCCEIGV